MLSNRDGSIEVALKHAPTTLNNFDLHSSDRLLDHMVDPKSSIHESDMNPEQAPTVRLGHAESAINLEPENPSNSEFMKIFTDLAGHCSGAFPICTTGSEIIDDQPGHMFEMIRNAQQSLNQVPSGKAKLRTESLPIDMQKEIIRYCFITKLSYARGEVEQLLGLRPSPTGDKNNLSYDIKDNIINESLMTAAFVAITPSDDASSDFHEVDLGRITNIDSDKHKLVEKLKNSGFYFQNSGIKTPLGLTAKLFERKLNNNSTELVLCFPGLGANDLVKRQDFNRQKAVIGNIVGSFNCGIFPWSEKMYSEAELLASIMGEYKNMINHKYPDEEIQLTVSGHSLGGGFAMVAANVDAVDQAISFQAYPALRGKVQSNALDKIIQVNIDKQTGIEHIKWSDEYHNIFNIIPTDGLIPKFIQNYHDVHRIEMDAHPTLDPTVYRPHAFDLSHLLMTFYDSIDIDDSDSDLDSEAS